MTTTCHSLDAGPWHVRHPRIDRLGAWPFPLPEHCQHCGHPLRYLTVLENGDSERLYVGGTCARRLLREGRDDA